MKHLIVVLLITFVLIGCDDSRVYEVNQEFDDRYWLSDSVQHFTFTINDSLSTYNIYYNLRNSVSYPFRNIYVQYNLKDSTGNTLKTDLLNGQLFEEKTGKPLGEGLGDVFDHQFSIINEFQFPYAGTYEIDLNQYMRRDTLPEILAVGVRVEKSMKE
ncbi:MAG: gliding motility lipoprotein GldH [Cyclobacteriaceae bacterium]